MKHHALICIDEVQKTLWYSWSITVTWHGSFTATIFPSRSNISHGSHSSSARPVTCPSRCCFDWRSAGIPRILKYQAYQIIPDIPPRAIASSICALRQGKSLKWVQQSTSMALSEIRLPLNPSGHHFPHYPPAGMFAAGGRVPARYLKAGSQRIKFRKPLICRMIHHNISMYYIICMYVYIYIIQYVYIYIYHKCVYIYMSYNMYVCIYIYLNIISVNIYIYRYIFII